MKATYVCNSDRLDERGNEINHDHESHRETAETTELVQEDEFSQIVDGGVNPTTTLRQQNLPIIWSDGVCMGVPNELRLEVGEVFQQKRREVSIFTEMEQILHVQSIHAIFRIVLDQLVRNQQGLVRIRGTETIKRETTGQTSDGAEKTFERLRHVMGNEVLVDLQSVLTKISVKRLSDTHLHHRDDRLLRVSQLGLSANAQKLLIVDHPTDKLATGEDTQRTLRNTYAETKRLRERGATVVSASTMNRYS